MSTGQRFNLPYAVVENNVGVPINGAKLYFYLTGTTTPHDTWSDVGLTTPNTNPVVADSSGRFPNVFLDPTVAYKVVLTDSAGVQIWTADPVQGVPPISQQPDLGGAWVTINLLNGGLVDTSQTTSQNILVHVDPVVETGITYLGNAAEGTTKRIRVDAAADIFFGFDNFGAGQTLFGFNEYMTAAYTLPNAAGRLTIDPDDIAEFVALSTTNTVGDRCWMLTSFKSAKFVSYMLRPNGNGHIDPADYLFVVGNPKYLQTQPHIPMWSFMVDPIALSGAAKIYAGELDLNCVGDGTRIRMTAFAKDPVTGEPITTSVPGSFISKRPGVISPLDGKIDFITSDWSVAPVIVGSPSSLYQGFSSGVYFECTEDPTDVKTPGVILFGVCSSPSDPATAGQHYNITPWYRGWVHPSGAFVFAGKSAFEQNPGTWSWDPANPIQWHSPSGYCNGRDTKGWGNVSIVASDITNATCDNFAALAMRGYNDLTSGIDFGFDGTYWGMYSVSASVRTRMWRMAPGTAQWFFDSVTSLYTNTSAGATPVIITLANSGTTAGTGTSMGFQCGASNTNNTANIRGRNDGSGNIAMVLQVAPNAPAVDGLILFGNKTLQLPGYGAGTLTTDASGNVTATSDETIKTNFQPFTRSLADLRAMDAPCSYALKAELADISSAGSALAASQVAEADALAKVDAAKTAWDDALYFDGSVSQRELSERQAQTRKAYLEAHDAYAECLNVRQRNEYLSTLGEPRYAGWTAQAVQKGIPEAVRAGPDGLLHLSERPVLAAAVNAILELEDTVKAQAQTISDLQTQLADLAAKVAALTPSPGA